MKRKLEWGREKGKNVEGKRGEFGSWNKEVIVNSSSSGECGRGKIKTKVRSVKRRGRGVTSEVGWT